LKRIEAAIKHKDQAALLWALGYCTIRIEIATRKEHLKHWRKIESKVRSALQAVETDGELKTIYVRLLDEGTDVWRPVQAMQINRDTFRIVSENSHPERRNKRIWSRPERKVQRIIVGRG
jgi:hypothetical protein